MPIDLIYDITVERDDQECWKEIHAPESVFQKVAAILLKIATEKPDESGIDDLGGNLSVDHETQASFFSFALQCFGSMICGLEDTDMPLRTKPTDDCVLQQYQSDTWVDVFDFGQCLSHWLSQSGGEQDYKDQLQDIPTFANEVWDDYESKYTGTSASYDPSLVISGGGAVAAKAALCRVLETIIREYADTGKKAKEQLTDEISRYSLGFAIGIAVVGVLAAILAFGTAGTSLVAFAAYFGTIGSYSVGGAIGGLIIAGLSAWVQVIKDTEIVVFTDNQAIKQLSCLWYNQLKTEADISIEEYSAVLSMTTATGHTEALYNACWPLVQQPLSYATFLRKWKEQIAYEAVIPSETPCDCEAVVVLVATLGFLLYEGNDEDGYDVYTLHSVPTGNYATAAAVREGGGGFHVAKYENGSEVLGFAQIGGLYYAPSEFPPEGVNTDAVVHYSVPENYVSRIWVEPAI